MQPFRMLALTSRLIAMLVCAIALFVLMTSFPSQVVEAQSLQGCNCQIPQNNGNCGTGSACKPATPPCSGNTVSQSPLTKCVGGGTTSQFCGNSNVTCTTTFSCVTQISKCEGITCVIDPMTGQCVVSKQNMGVAQSCQEVPNCP